MSALDLALVRFLLASLGCLVAGVGAWGVTALCRRWLPALALQRSTWLLAQLTVAASLVALMLPHSERLRVVPVIEVDEAAPVRAATAPALAASTDASASTAARGATADERPWLADVARAWAVLYALGLACATVRCLRGQRLVDALARGGHPLVRAGAHHAGLAAVAEGRLPRVIEVDAPIAPMLLGPFKPRLLLPRHLREFDPLQQQLIVEHELTHWRRHDLGWMMAGLALQLLFWFNPAMRALRERLSWAQELGCDRDVLRGRPAIQRKAYAAALVAQLKCQRQPFGAALAFGDHGAPALAARIELIRTPAAGARAPWVRIAALGSLALVFIGSLALQPALAWHAAALPSADGQVLRTVLAAVEPIAVTGPLHCTEIVDAASGAPLVREGTCAASITPASTFKIPLSLMGFDSGVLADEHAPRLPFRKGYLDYVPTWRHATDPAGWIRDSVVWYSQQVAQRLGGARVRDYVERFGYGNRDLSGLAGVDDARAFSELSPTLRISPDEQAVFLRKLVNRQLPVSGHAYEMAARVLVQEAPVNGWKVYGKTGTAMVPAADGSEDRTQNYGWFVGWATKDGRTVVFARLLQETVRKDEYGGARAKAMMLDELARRSTSL